MERFPPLAKLRTLARMLTSLLDATDPDDAAALESGVLVGDQWAEDQNFLILPLATSTEQTLHRLAPRDHIRIGPYLTGLVPALMRARDALGEQLAEWGHKPIRELPPYPGETEGLLGETPSGPLLIDPDRWRALRRSLDKIWDAIEHAAAEDAAQEALRMGAEVARAVAQLRREGKAKRAQLLALLVDRDSIEHEDIKDQLSCEDGAIRESKRVLVEFLESNGYPFTLINESSRLHRIPVERDRPDAARK